MIEIDLKCLPKNEALIQIIFKDLVISYVIVARKLAKFEEYCFIDDLEISNLIESKFYYFDVDYFKRIIS